MKLLLTLLLTLTFILSGCSGGSKIIDAVTSITWISAYQAAGGSGFYLTQTNGVNMTTIVNPPVVGNSIMMPVSGCDIGYDISTIDPINTAFWLAEPLTVDYDKSMFTCGVSIQCTVGAVTMVNGIATANFTCL